MDGRSCRLYQNRNRSGEAFHAVNAVLADSHGALRRSLSIGLATFCEALRFPLYVYGVARCFFIPFTLRNDRV